MKPILPTVAAILLAAPLTAQSGNSYSHTSDAPLATAVQTTEAIHVDGVLDEEAWSAAQPITSFTQLDPREGTPVSQRTEVRILYDDQALYLGARLHDTGEVRGRLGRRDMPLGDSDWLTVIIDSYHGHRTAYGFEVNPAGVRRDQTRAGDQEDDSWEPVWQAATTVDDAGWTAELRIPFSQLRFSGEPLQTWGLQVERTIARNREFAVWSFTPRDEPAGIPRYGHLTGLENIPTGKRLEILPYTVARAEYVDRPGNPFRSDQEYAVDAGVDLKYRVTSNLTLDATINPDFGQVEVDPAVINLSALETFFEEKRPFFIEGAEIFTFGQGGSNNVFYSRRIGARPSLAPPYAASDVPDAARILGAAKLSGRSAGGWSLGVLNAVTAREMARFQAPGGDRGEMVVEPLTNYFVGRLRREMRTGQTAVGGFFGAVNRNLDSERLDASLRSAAYSGGVDLFHQWDERTWTLTGFLAGSHIRGEPEVIEAAQRAPYRYFQRPDADHLEVEPTRSSLSGFSGEIALSKRVGRHWYGSTALTTISPGYDVNDLGFMRRTDRVDASLIVEYSETRPGDVLRQYSMYIQPLVEHNYDWENISNRIFAGSFIQLLNYWSANVNFTYSLPGTVDDRLTRGGPAAYRPGYWAIGTFFGSDGRKPVVIEPGVYYENDRVGGHVLEGSLDVLVKPAPNWEVSLAPVISRSRTAAQYIAAIADPIAAETFGTRYVFAELDQTVMALETRLNYTFTPALSLQLYAQPFVATGEFGPPKEFAEPGTFDFLVYGEDVGEVVDGVVYPDGVYEGAPSFPAPQPDFNLRSLRGNAVLRWEWRPGSTLYLAWQQTRQGFAPTGEFDFRRDTDAIFAAPPDNIFLIKMNYWLNP